MQVLMQMANYAEYAEVQHDEEPLYIFDRLAVASGACRSCLPPRACPLLRHVRAQALF